MSKPTIKELARELGIAVSTVSKALRDSHEISAETKAKVLETAARLNYIPNLYASSLRRQKSRTIAVVIPEVADSFFALAINGIEEVAREKGYHVLIYLSHESLKRETEILHDFKSGRVDGIMISVTAETCNGTHIREAMDSSLPVVFFDRTCEEVQTASVITDDFDSSYKATNLLISKGSLHPVYLSISRELSVTRKREEGFLTALKENNIDKADSIIECSDSETGLQEQLRDLLQRPVRPDGIVISVEKLVFPVYSACRNLNLRIPEDIKLIGFTNLPASALLQPALSTITQPAFEIGRTAAALLFKGIEKSAFNLSAEKIIIPSQLHERASSGA